VIFRTIQESDHNMIRASFVETARKSAQCNGASPEFLSAMAMRAIETCKNATVLCDEDTPDEIIGWMIWDDPENVFWLAVKPRYQGQNFGRMLLSNAYVGIGFPTTSPVHVPVIVGHAQAWAGRMGIRLSPRPYMVTP